MMPWALGGEGQLKGIDSEYSSTPTHQAEERRGGGDKYLWSSIQTLMFQRNIDFIGPQREE